MTTTKKMKDVHLDCNDFYDDVETPHSSVTDRSIDPKTFEEHIRRDTKKDTCFFMLKALQSIINEQILAQTLDKTVGQYLYDALKDQASQRGWL